MKGEKKMFRQVPECTTRREYRMVAHTLFTIAILAIGAIAGLGAQQHMPENAGPRGRRYGQAQARAEQPVRWQEQVGTFLSLAQERHRLEQQKGQLLNRLVDTKKRLEKEQGPLRRFFLRKEIDQIESDLHLAIEASMAKQQEQRQMIRQFIKNSKQIEEAIARRSEEIDRQIAELKGAPEANRTQLARLQREQTRLSRMKELLAMMQADPERLVEQPPTELPEPVSPPPAFSQEPMPWRLRDRLDRLEKHLQFLQKRIDDCQKEIQEIQELLAPYLSQGEMPEQPAAPPPQPEPETTSP
jgi:chromosome segregation ATPase